MVAYQTTTIDWVCPGMLSHTQTFLDLPQVFLGTSTLGGIPD